MLRASACPGLFSVPSWVIRDETGALPSLFLNFELGLAYYLGQVVPISSLLTVVRASGGYNAKLDGSLQWFGNNTLRQTDAGLLVEGARTNLLLRSQEFDNASWSKSVCTVTADDIIAPDGTLTADRLISGGSGGRVTQPITATATTVTLGVRLRAGNAASAVLLIYNTTTAQTIGSVVVTISSGVPVWDGFYRHSLTVSSGIAVGNTIVAYVYPYGTSAPVGSYVHAWGAQLEAAAFASSYIPTGASAALRAADNISVNDVSFIGSEGTFFAETFGSANNESYGRIVGLTSNTSALNRGIGSNNVQAYNGAQVLNAILGSGTWGGLVRSAVAYNGSGRALCGNAGTVATDANPLGSAANMWIGSQQGSSAQFFGNIRRLAYYPRKISNAGLQQMTAV